MQNSLQWFQFAVYSFTKREKEILFPLLSQNANYFVIKIDADEIKYKAHCHTTQNNAFASEPIFNSSIRSSIPMSRHSSSLSIRLFLDEWSYYIDFLCIICLHDMKIQCNVYVMIGTWKSDKMAHSFHS